MNDYDCSDIITIETIMKSLVEATKSSAKIYYNGLLIDYQFLINEKASQNNIINLERELCCKLPEDYKDFLACANGVTMSHYAKVYGIDEILENRTRYNFYPLYLLPIAECANSEIHILLHLESESPNRIYVIDTIGDDYFSSINCDFTIFLNRFVLTYGSNFWDWGKQQTEIPKIP